jgi:hypothetical protein
MNAQEIVALKNGIRELVRRRPGYRSVGLVRKGRGFEVLIDVAPTAKLDDYEDVLGVRRGVKIRVRRVTGQIKADLRAG